MLELLKRHSEHDEQVVLEKLPKAKKQKPKDPYQGIRCPKCKWRPVASSRWWCTCGHCWNTFDTRGKCPGCKRQWFDTACHGCNQWSPHEDWYEAQRGTS